ncbi:uncharacterized protein [Aegilops tauschii subsp. strangulata]|uniref:RING-type domain-containing protein n=1 Tax=Aegilops tauschii subsp. strangulata TaxID=200361 RepID=A0A453GGF0_AEGTS|nr:uncharacterized protein LOC109748421 [Aegilops tauschii subsp. strangulata]
MGSPDDQMNPCAICLGSMVADDGGQAIFTAECSHAFHFRCISDSVAHGHLLCPLCKAQWRDLPLVRPTSLLSAITTQSQSEERPPSPPQPVDRAESERVRAEVHESIAAARAAAERGATQEAVNILDKQQLAVLRSGAARIGDPIIVELGAELLKMRRQAHALNQQMPARMLAGMSARTQQPRARMKGPRMSVTMPPRARIQVAGMSARAPTQRRASSRQKRQPSAGSGSGSLTAAGVKKRKAPNPRSQGRA